MIADCESDELAEALTMRSKLVADLLVDLNVVKSHSRPYISDDNPFSEAQFKTMKYRPNFPERFHSLAQARAFCQTFFPWYNYQHRHSGIGYMTPAAMHSGVAAIIYDQRALVLQDAFLRHPNRFKHCQPYPPALPTMVGINMPKLIQEGNEKTQI